MNILLYPFTNTKKYFSVQQTNNSTFTRKKKWCIGIVSALAIGFLFSSELSLQAQTATLSSSLPKTTSAKERTEAFSLQRSMKQNSPFKNIPFTNIGPSVQSCRVTDVDVNPGQPEEFYVAYATGGLWKTTTNGISFEPLFDTNAVITIGDIGVFRRNNKPDILWVGTGEVNSSRSSYAGLGMYKSSDGGKTWQQRGLEESHHIGRVLLHPTDSNTLWVASMGPLYSFGKQRGIYKTTDGGLSWRNTLQTNDSAGAIDIVADPNNPSVLYAATWHRERTAWNFVEGGSASAIYKSSDGGDSWQCLTCKGSSGFPSGKNVGRIGLAVAPSAPNTLYAVVDNQASAPRKDTTTLRPDSVAAMSVQAFLALPDSTISAFLDAIDVPTFYSVDSVKNLINNKKLTIQELASYGKNANQALFEPDVLGAELYRSDDGGISWRKTHEKPLENVFYSFGYYFAQVRVAPDSPEKVYVLGVPAIYSSDGGATFRSFGEGTHVDHHALWLHPTNSGHIILGNDGGIALSYDNGESWFHANTPPVGQIYAISFDMEKPYNVTAGFQDNGTWRGPSSYAADNDWVTRGRYPYSFLYGGDGMQSITDPRNSSVMYVGYQFGNYARINTQQRSFASIKPVQLLGEPTLRFNWQTPILLSAHQPDILYYGSQFVHRSFNRGDSYERLSPDLTKGAVAGDVPFGTLTALAESPIAFRYLYAGSDDGLVHVSKDAGTTWQRISDGLPQGYWVSRIVASAHDSATVYVSLNGYRNDDFSALVYVSHDFGANWKRISDALPKESVNVIREDPKYKGRIYVGTDAGVYLSNDTGKTYVAMGGNLPTVPVHDLLIHPRERDLLLGTHGRSMFKASLHECDAWFDSLSSKNIFLTKIDTVRFRSSWGEMDYGWTQADEPSISIVITSNSNQELTLQIQRENTVLHKQTIQASIGIQYVEYNGRVTEQLPTSTGTSGKSSKKSDKSKENDFSSFTKADNGEIYLQPGNYTVTISNGKERISQPLIVHKSDRSRRVVAKKKTP